MITETIANALFHYLDAQLHNKSAVRRFFRLDGFDDETYVYLLTLFQNKNNIIGNQRFEVRTTSLISGFSDYVRAEGKSATWYRNYVSDGEALLLIFNEHTTDAQSLKDIYAITESQLSDDGISSLVAVSFTGYALKINEINILQDFLKRLRRQLFRPQLRDLTRFLIELNSLLHQGDAMNIKSAIAEALPHLGLFRSQALAEHLNTTRGDKQLRDMFRAARKGDELLEEREQNALLDRLESTSFQDDSDLGGLASIEKQQLLRGFLTKVLTDRNELVNVLKLDWREVEPVLHKKTRKTQSEKLQELAESIEQAIDITEDLSEEALEALEDLKEGNDPDREAIEQLLAEKQESLGKRLSNQLRRLRGGLTHQDTDFIVGLTNVAIRLLEARQEDLPEGAKVCVTFDETQLKVATEKEWEALEVFCAIYGGIDHRMPAFQWELANLWAAEVGEPSSDESEEMGERDKRVKAELVFGVSLQDANQAEIDHATLTWLYLSGSPWAVTCANLKAEATRVNDPASSGPLFGEQSARLSVPIYNTCVDSEDIGDIDLSQPAKSVGSWYKEPNNLRQIFLAEIRRRSKPPVIEQLEKVLDNLEFAWANFVLCSVNHGILSANHEELLSAYESLLSTAATQLRGAQEASYGFRILTQAWMIGSNYFEHWAMMPFLHPIKLQWWFARTHQYNQLIEKLLSSEKIVIADERRFRQELTITYGSNGYPAIVALPGQKSRPAYFLPVDEVEGYELYRHIDQVGIAHGLDPELVSEAEGYYTADIVAQELARVIRDYVETYPFVRDGLEIYLIECRNSVLPELLVERLDKLSRRLKWSLRLSINIHTTDRGAPLFQRIKNWLGFNETLKDRPSESYFPNISVKVLESDPFELFNQIEDRDLVILADVLAESGQEISAEFEQLSENNLSDSITTYLPLQRIRQAPFERNELTREILLTSSAQPSLLSHFYNAQWTTAEARHAVRTGEVACFRQVLSLRDQEQLLRDLHHHFNWVVCYDTTIDRFLLEATFPETVQVIRYSLGLGVKRKHNLTVSSSNRAQDIVIRRLTTRLSDLLPGTPDGFREIVAQQLVNEAKRVSGDIVLRAAGPGAYLNELIGLILAKHSTEQRYLEQHPGALTAWIYLDDFAHWFDRKFPDLIFVAVPVEANGELPIHVEVLETKCVGDASFPVEAADAQKQVREGVNRLGRVWAADTQHLDAPYWYDQLYRAVVGNLEIVPEQERLWIALRDRLPKGDFTLKMSGQSWIFCYESAAGISGYVDEGVYSQVARDVPDVPLFYHHYNRTGLRRLLREIVDEKWALESPPETWSTKHDESITNSKEQLDNQEEITSEVIDSETNISECIGRTSIKIAVQSTENPTSKEVTETPAESAIDEEWLKQTGRDLDYVLQNYGVRALPVDPNDADIGPSIIRFKLRLRPGEQLSRVQKIAEDMARELRSRVVPFIDNILGTNYVGIDLPRAESEIVPLIPYLAALAHPKSGELPIILGKTPNGQVLIEDLSEFPHLLVAGATNSGKSVFLRSLVLCLITQYLPSELKFLIVDPKRTDFSFFNNLPHLIGGKVITEKEEACDLLLELVHNEMPRRQRIMAGRSLRVKEFNIRFPNEALPLIVAIIDEYAQLISIMNKGDRDAFEQDLMSLAAVARSTGIHLVLATQRPSADIVTGTLKANLPASIAFKVASAVNSRIVIDQNGAENLLGRGDMLFRHPNGELVRLQAAYIDEVELQYFLSKS